MFAARQRSRTCARLRWSSWSYRPNDAATARGVILAVALIPHDVPAAVDRSRLATRLRRQVALRRPPRGRDGEDLEGELPPFCLAFVFVWVKNVGRGRHQPTATGRRSGSLRDSDRKAIGCHRLRLGLGVQIDVLTAESTPERAK